MIRMDKYLASMGLGTRQEVKKYLKQGRITVDQKMVTAADQKIDEKTAVVAFDGIQVSYQEFEYYMLHKPAGVISATEDKKEKTVLDLITETKRKDLFPVGRLDKDTEGLLLITNDGKLAHRLLSPKKHVDKVYYAKIKGIVTQKEADVFLKGVNIGSEEEPQMTLPAKLQILESAPLSEIRLTIREGKFHQVKRMFEAVGMEVVYLKREEMGPLKLDPVLEKGAYRRLTKKEITDLEKA